MRLFLSGRRMFTTACVSIIVVAFLHTLGNTLPEPPATPEYFGLLGVMHGYKIPLGMGMAPSMWDIHRDLVFTMSISFVAIGVLGLVVSGSADATPRLISRLAVVGTITSAALTALSAYYRVPPPLITMAIVTVLFAVAIRTSR